MLGQTPLTFNPGWNKNAAQLETFTGVRDIQRQLKEQGVELFERSRRGHYRTGKFYSR